MNDEVVMVAVVGRKGPCPMTMSTSRDAVCSAGELRAGSRIKEKASAVPAAARWAPALQPPARLGGWNGWRKGEAVDCGVVVVVGVVPS